MSQTQHVVPHFLCFSICIFFLCPNVLSLLAGFGLNDRSCTPKECREANIAVPLPFNCQVIPSDCYEAKNLLRPNESIEVFFNEVAVIYNQSMVFCPSAMLTTPELNEWRIELKTIHNVYAILLWRNGPLDQPEKMKVRVVREVSSYHKKSVECRYSIQYDNYHYFYCYSDTKLTSDYRLGIEGNSVEITGKVFIDSSRDFRKSVKVYSYPVRLCAPPEIYENQTVHPTREYYFVGQQVEYTCQGVVSKLVGNSTRTCKLNGLWSGRTPICVQVKKISPVQYSLAYFNGTETEVEPMRPYLPALTRHQAVVLIPRQTLTLELGKAYCLQDVFISYYTEPSKRSNITVTIAPESFIKSTAESLSDESRIINYGITNGNETFICTRQIIIERHRDKVESEYVLAESILEVYARGYEDPAYQCLNLSMFASYEFARNELANNETFELRCSQGFEPDQDYPPKVPQTVINCRNGAWKGHLPKCKRTFCSNPGKNDFSTWVYKVDSNNETILTEVIYQCNEGFELQGESESKCVNGSWTNAPPFCQATHCPSIETSKGRSIRVEGLRREMKNSDIFYHHGVTVHFQCSPGFDLIGNQSAVCLNKTWSSSFPTCKEIVCDFPPFKVHGLESNSTSFSNWSIGDHNFTCPMGFTIGRGTSEKMVYVELHCQPNGRWLEEIEEFECTQQSERLAAIELALISAGAVLTIAAMAAIAIVGCKILNNRRRQRNKVVPLAASDELNKPTKELNEHLVQSAKMLVTTEGDHLQQALSSAQIPHECESSEFSEDDTLHHP